MAPFPHPRIIIITKLKNNLASLQKIKIGKEELRQ